MVSYWHQARYVVGSNAMHALIWSLRRTHKAVLWTDSAYVATHFWRLQASPCAELPNSHGDLWQEVRDNLSVSNGGFKVIHVPAHQQHDTNLAEADMWTEIRKLTLRRPKDANVAWHLFGRSGRNIGIMSSKHCAMSDSSGSSILQ
ncbi:unnamed protein product [Effrenium voratum]|uniref:RNase H type-1 domain-containing protein n=1 Tax=Effrenium voratum TaxID=2562239 RepID=A0AA36I204_9DINO|nr:unnamed protein product [Effrenium voratum]